MWVVRLGFVGNAVVPTLAVRLYCDHPAVPCAIPAVYRRHAQRGIFRAGHTVRLDRRYDRWWWFRGCLVGLGFVRMAHAALHKYLHTMPKKGV
jgi:hypothetical protein